MCIRDRGDTEALVALIDDELLYQFALPARWDDMADKLIERYKGTAARLAMYHAEENIRDNPDNLGKWSEISRAVRAAK